MEHFIFRSNTKGSCKHIHTSIMLSEPIGSWSAFDIFFSFFVQQEIVSLEELKPKPITALYLRSIGLLIFYRYNSAEMQAHRMAGRGVNAYHSLFLSIMIFEWVSHNKYNKYRIVFLPIP